MDDFRVGNSNATYNDVAPGGPTSSYLPASADISTQWISPDILQFSVDMNEPGSCTLRVFDMTGREVWENKQVNVHAGLLQVQWMPGHVFFNGVYLVRLETETGIAQTKVLLMR
jgi:hypothetical protein